MASAASHPLVRRRHVTRTEYTRACIAWKKIADLVASDGVVFDASFKAFRRNGRVVPGLTRTLSQCWRNYDYRAVNGGSVRKFLRRDRSLKNPQAGRARGSLVHAQLDGFVKGDMSAGLHTFGFDALTTVRRLGLCPIAAEEPVYDSATGLATAVDMVAATPGGGIAFIEIKNGSLGTFRRSSAPMLGPFGRVMRNSPREQALAQLAMTVRMARQYGAVIAEAYVINPNAEECTFVPLPAEVRNTATSVAAFLMREKELARARTRQPAAFAAAQRT